ncbi:MAG: HAD family hydrolase [Candidatus Omnitrophica bacterium]|nr:HAD family hydrolase [Candidatus Omnitrophota bacterium]
MKIIFLDRDGVINRYPGDNKYVTRWSEFKFLRGVKSALKKLIQNGFKIFIISNQAGVSKGIFSQDALNRITKNMLNEFKKSAIHIEGVFYCVHREEDNCSCRKPKIGLLEKAVKSLGINKIDKKDCFFIGDTLRDVQTGKAFGCRTVLVFSGKEKLANRDKWKIRPDFTATDLCEATHIILKR